MSYLLCVLMITTSLASQQQPLKIAGPKATYQLGPSTPINVDEGLYTHEVIVSDPRQRTVDRIRWSDHASSFNRGVVYKDMLVLVGTVGGIGDALSILDTASGKHVLFALCRMPALSPSGRYIAYLQFVPRHIEGTLDDIVLVLDLENLHTIVPSSVGWVVDSTNVGTAIYPAGFIGKTHFYAATNGAETSPNLIPPPPAWDSKLDILAFVSKVADRWSLISADLTAGLDQRKLMRRSLEGPQFLSEKSNDLTTIKRVEKELMIDRLEVENGVASVWTAEIPGVKLRKVVVPLLQR
jgi:hypothetical protein